MRKDLKNLFLAFFALVAFVGVVHANTTTTNYSLNKPAVNDAGDQDIWGDLLNDNFDTIDTQMKTNADAAAVQVPVGSVMFYAGSSAPTDWLLAYGQTIGDVSSGADVEDADLETLFDIVKVAYGNAGTEDFGSGDTVALPDCRGRVIAGQDDMGGSSANNLTDQSGGLDGDTLGDTGGAETHTLTEAQLAAHDHNLQTVGQGESTAHGSGNPPTGSGGSTSYGNAGATPILDAGSGQPHNNVQPTIILNCIIYANHE